MTHIAGSGLVGVKVGLNRRVTPEKAASPTPSLGPAEPRAESEERSFAGPIGSLHHKGFARGKTEAQAFENEAATARAGNTLGPEILQSLPALCHSYPIALARLQRKQQYYAATIQESRRLALGKPTFFGQNTGKKCDPGRLLAPSPHFRKAGVDELRH